MTIFELFLTKGGSMAIVIALVLVVFYVVRRLYGPKGMFRDAHWDYQNELARLSEESDSKYRMAQRSGTAYPPEEPRKLMKDILLRINSEPFIEYAYKYRTGDKDRDMNILLKQDHSIRVLENAAMLIAGEWVLQEKKVMHCLLLAALYHDIGRFEQLRIYNTFSDHTSCNHAALGIKVLKEGDFLRDESAQVRHIVLAAISLHNKSSLPQNIEEPYRKVAAALRDADKLDILRIMAEGIGNKEKIKNAAESMGILDEPDKFSPLVLDAIKEGRPVNYSDMRYLNDFRILLCGWVFDFNFVTSMLFLKKTGILEPIIRGLSEVPEVQAAVSAIVEESLQSLPEDAFGKGGR